MADIDRPKTQIGSHAEPFYDSAVNGFAVTPVEGLELDALPKIPMDPDEVLALLKARLALDEKDVAALGRLAQTSSYEATKTSTRTWPPKDGVPSSPDITPSPVVIGIDEIEAMAAEPMPEASPVATSPDGQHDREQRDTPAEPVASVRVRRAEVHNGAIEQAAKELRAARVVRDSTPAQYLGSLAGRLYFPPMKPPESWQGGHADEPLVQIVPECDAKTRTARSLRRPSNWPTPSYLTELRGRTSVLRLSAGVLLVGMVIAIFSAPWIWSHSKPVPVRTTRPVATLAPTPLASVDSGLGTPPAATPNSTSTSSAKANTQRASEPPSPQHPPKNRRPPVPKAAGTLAPDEDKLIFE